LGEGGLGVCVCERDYEMRPFYRPEGGGGAAAQINAGTQSQARRDAELRRCGNYTPWLRTNNPRREVGDGLLITHCAAGEPARPLPA
jgi:hypothetical protein